eukprot:62455-Pelagomonas_calceolata.AAC.1
MNALQDADIIFMPYNYLLDANTRKTLVDQVRPSAHNVEGVCSDASSCDLTAKQLTDALAEAKSCDLAAKQLTDALAGAKSQACCGLCKPLSKHPVAHWKKVCESALARPMSVQQLHVSQQPSSSSKHG